MVFIAADAIHELDVYQARTQRAVLSAQVRCHPLTFQQPPAADSYTEPSNRHELEAWRMPA